MLDVMTNDIAPVSETSAHTATSTAILRPRVLLAEPNGDMRHHLGRLLNNDGYEVLSVADREVALMVAKRRTDFEMKTGSFVPTDARSGSTTMAGRFTIATDARAT
jgi:hypothetical protein